MFEVSGRTEPSTSCQNDVLSFKIEGTTAPYKNAHFAKILPKITPGDPGNHRKSKKNQYKTPSENTHKNTDS